MFDQSKIIIRESNHNDYQAIANIYNAVDREMPVTAQNIEERDKKQDDRCKHKRWVAILNDYIIATCYYSQEIIDIEPRKFTVMVWVHPNYQKQGIELIMWEHVTTNLCFLSPHTIDTWFREDSIEIKKKLEEDGFSEKYRSRVSTLEVPGFDLAPYKDLKSSLLKSDIEIKTLSELESDPNRDHKLYDLEWEITQDIPGLGEVTKTDFETFVDECIKSEHNRLDGNFVAVHNEEFVGLSLLQINPSGNEVIQNITGVKLSYRRQGIARALKLQAIIFAKENNISKIRTINDITNLPMLSLNKQLGFLRSSVWILYQKNNN